MSRQKHTSRNDRSSIPRAVIWFGAIFTLLVAVHWLAGMWAESYLRKQMDVIAAQTCAIVNTDPQPDITVDLLGRRIAITGLSFIQDASCKQGPLEVSGRLDTLEIDGISLTGLLFQRKLAMATLHLATTGLSVRYVVDSSRVTPEHRSDRSEPWSVEIGSLRSHLRSSIVVTAHGDTIRSMGDGVHVQANELRYRVSGEGQAPTRSVELLSISSDSVMARMHGGYAFAMARGVVDQQQGTIVLNGLHASPRGGLEAFSAGLRYETDVIEAHLDTLRLSGVDLNKSLSSGAVSVALVKLRSGKVVILRDKTLPDGPSVEVPLLGELIRRLPAGNGVDTITVKELDVLYREQADVTRGYAEVPFDRIDATITGVRNDPQDTNSFMIDAHCKAFTDVPVSMVLSSMVQDTMDRFTLDALIGTMPFATLNKVIGPLADIRALEGSIESVTLHMDADAYSAKGLVQLAYHDLKLETGGRKRKEAMNQLGTLLLNTLVKKDNRNSGGPRQGNFAFDRRRDRAVFNYMWSGLREGAKEILLPQALTK